jgi:hypothetical protein
MRPRTRASSPAWHDEPSAGVLSLSSLAGWEQAVLSSIAGATGAPDERDRQIERAGMYGEYPAIVHSYIELFDDEESSLEALKRALFLVWRSAMALPMITGLAALPESTSRRVIEQLDDTVRRGADDAELRWMLAWYRAEGSFVLELYGATARVMSIGADLDADAWRAEHFEPLTMAQRGQMGRYWAALAASEGRER